MGSSARRRSRYAERSTPVAKRVREQASAVTLRPHVAKLGDAAATFLISLSSRGPPGDVGRPPADT